ncbi:DUF5641 domain-containing protein [Caerostris darwini]|uniref:DUF5641 domain-containing protein n=1 Tax=Caerostris darwini TaxID=1538125 RepID=A0AAV4SCB7_9ARAC|nr:DUF5641 domain-containing protein [Caerostris darwini]
MATLLCECESIANGRPLTYIYDDPNVLRAIKPSDFIQDIKGNETMDLYLRKRIRYLQNLRYQLRQLFQKEYLSELIRSPQSFSKRRNLSPGDIVLVGSDNTKRLNWALGRIIELFKGKDNVEEWRDCVWLKEKLSVYSKDISLAIELFKFSMMCL